MSVLPVRVLAAAALTGLLASACGARLSPAERADAIAATRGGAGGGTSAVTAAGPAGNGLPSGAVPLPVSTGAAVPGAGGATRTGPATGPGSTAVGPAGGGGGAGGATSADTRAAPPGGNGGATDVGVTADSVTIGNVSDISGAVPGLFQDAQLAVTAYVAYFAAREGTIYGRKLKLLALDSRLDTGANRSQSIEECDKAFAGVGSVSAFDQGGAPVIAQCGLPDLRGLSTTDQMKAVPNAFPINSAGTGGQRSMGVFGWAAKEFPDAVKKAAYVYIDGEVTRQLAQQDMEGAQNMLGYNWIYPVAVGITETNYGPVVQQMKSKGVRYVTFVGAYQQAASLARTMKQQGFTPDVFQPTVTAYTPEFIKQAGDAAEGVYVAVAPSLNEEINGNPELGLYAQWLNQVEPGATPTGIGQYAWAAASLFVQEAKKIGPHLTRKALLALIPPIRAYTGNGLFPPNDVGGRTLSDCTSVVQVKGGQFVRHTPPQVRGNRCGDGIWDSKTKKSLRAGPQ